MSLGFGTAIMQLCAIVEIQQAFPSNVVIAQTIASLGFSGGSITAGLVMPSLLSTFGWRGTMALEGAVLLNTVVLAQSYNERTSATSLSESNNAGRRYLQPLIKEMFDFSLFGNAIFSLLCIGRMCVYFSFQNIISHSPGRAISIGLSFQQGTLFLSFTSLGTFCCRPIYVLIKYLCHVSNIVTAIVCTSAGSGLLAAVAFTYSFNFLIIIYIALGMAVGTCKLQYIHT